MKSVYENLETGEFSFDYTPGVSVCVGETDGELKDWIEWFEDQYKKRLLVG